MPFAPPSSSGRATACLQTRAPGSSRPGASRRSTGFAGARDSIRSRMSPSRSMPSPTTPRSGTTKASRTTGSDSIFTCCHPALAAGRAGGAHAARGLRPHDRGDRAGVPRGRSHAGAAHRARQDEDPRCAHSLPGADAPKNCRNAWTACCASIYLVFNEGYSASSGASLTRLDLSGEAIRLGRLLVELLPEPEAIGLLALMLLHESRRAAAHVAGGRPHPARRAGPLALEPRPDRGGVGAGGTGVRVAPLRPLHAPGGDRGGARRRRERRGHGLGARSWVFMICCCAPIRRPSSS